MARIALSIRQLWPILLAQRVIAGVRLAMFSLCASLRPSNSPRLRPILADGHRVFGENRVQEAQGKWPALKADYPDIALHLIGPLQSNKARDAVLLFDVIETIDRPRIAAAVAQAMRETGKNPKLYVQINIGDEPQKAGVAVEDADSFLAACTREHGLQIAGLMCIPPADQQASPFFALLGVIAKRNNIPILSMGMSADYDLAIQLGATHVRVGSAIFGHRSSFTGS